MTPLERGQLGLMRVQAVVNGVVIAVAATAAELSLRSAPRSVLPFGTIMAAVAVLLVYTVLIAPGRRYRAWGYALGPEELVVRHGLLTRVETHVPLARVQHVDVSQGPLERAFGVCRLILHTAGTANSRVLLPGLARTTAEAIRDEVRARIRQEDA